MKKQFILLSCLISSQLLFSQFLRNPSFENSRGKHKMPTHWHACYASTPDTQPGYWGVTTAPSDGNSYTNLITRDNNSFYENTAEHIESELIKPLVPNQTYRLSIDLAYSDEWRHYASGEWYSYTTPALLHVYTSDKRCLPSNKIFTSSVVDHTEWYTYTFYFTVESEQNYIRLEAGWDGEKTYSGNVLIDNVIIKEVGENEQIDEPIDSVVPKYPKCTVAVEEIPNVITPNNDGKNDVLEINLSQQGITSNTFKVFDRWGEMMHETSDLDVVLNGNAMSRGVYFWVLEYSCASSKNPKDSKLAKGWVEVVR